MTVGVGMAEHGDLGEFDVATYLGNDSDLAMVTANMQEWSEAHPCDCEGVCICEDLENYAGSR